MPGKDPAKGARDTGRTGGGIGGGKASGGMGSFGDRGTGYGGLGYQGPGAGLGYHGQGGGMAIPGTRNYQTNIATRPATLGNLLGGVASIAGPALGMGLPGAGPLGSALMGHDYYSGPTGSTGMVNHDPTNNGGFYAQQGMGGQIGPGLMGIRQPGAPPMTFGQPPAGPVAAAPPGPPGSIGAPGANPLLMQLIQQHQLQVAPGYGVNVPGYSYFGPPGTPGTPGAVPNPLIPKKPLGDPRMA